MSVPSDVMKSLKCSNCGNYLSYYPILIKNDSSICGRCTSQLPAEDVASLVRNVPYENLAAAIEFPCRNQKFGCKKLLKPSAIPQHEKFCVLTPISCPFSECEWNGAFTVIHQHYNDCHVDAIVNEQLDLNLNKDLSTPFLYIYTDEDVFVITIELTKKLLVTSFSYLGSNHARNFNCQLLVTQDNDIYPLVISSSCSRYSRFKAPVISNTAQLDGQRAICHVQIQKILPKYKEFALSSSLKIHPEEFSNRISDFHYTCKNEQNGCTYSTQFKSEIENHEQECVFDERYDFTTAVCKICKETPFLNYKSIWEHYTANHSDSVTVNNNRFTWNLDNENRTYFLNFMNDIFVLKFNHRVGYHFQKFMWKVELIYQAVDVCRIYNYEITIIDVTKNNRKLMLAGPTHFYHYCYDETFENQCNDKICTICKDSLHLNREQLENFIIDNQLVFTVRIFKNN